MSVRSVSRSARMLSTSFITTSLSVTLRPSTNVTQTLFLLYRLTPRVTMIVRLAAMAATRRQRGLRCRRSFVSLRMTGACILSF